MPILVLLLAFAGAASSTAVGIGPGGDTKTYDVTLLLEVCTDGESCAVDSPAGAGGWEETTEIEVDYDSSLLWRATVGNASGSNFLEVGLRGFRDAEGRQLAVVDTPETGQPTLPARLLRGESASFLMRSEHHTASSAYTVVVDQTSLEPYEPFPFSIRGRVFLDPEQRTVSVVVRDKPVSSLSMVSESCDPEAAECSESAPAGTSGWSATTTVPYLGTGLWRTVVANTGDTTLTDVTVHDATALGCETAEPTLAAGASLTVVCEQPAVDGLVTNDTTVSALPPFGDPELTEAGSATITAAPALTGVSVSKEVCTTGTTCRADAPTLSEGWAKSIEVDPGTTVLWRTVTTDTGQVALTAAVVTDDIPGCSALVESLTPGQTHTTTCLTSDLTESVDAQVEVTATDARPSGGTVTAADSARATVRAASSTPSTSAPTPPASAPSSDGTEPTAAGGATTDAVPTDAVPADVVSATGSPLATTGASGLTLAATVTLVALLLGATLLVTARRRQDAHQD